MNDRERDAIWCVEGPWLGDGVYRRAEYVTSELKDSGRDVGIIVGNQYGTVSIALSRSEAQKLFDDLWQKGYRPN